MWLYANEVVFNRSLVKYYFPVKGTHVMKMVTKSRVFGKRVLCEKGFGQLLKEFYESLDDCAETRILLEVLQDENDFEVVFDFDSSNVEYVHPNCPGGSVWGLMDFKRNRVYVGANESDGYKRCDVVRTLAHELAHEVMSVVFQNHGKPYREGDLECKRLYENIVEDVLNDCCLNDCDDIIKRVKLYKRDVWEEELIVRVPEMIAMHSHHTSEGESSAESVGSSGEVEDGIDFLEQQVQELLKYYREHVMPALREYVEKNFTSNKMTVKGMSEYQQLLTTALGGKVEVGPL